MLTKKQKKFLIITGCLVFWVILLQNTQVISFQILFWRVSMSRIILFSLMIIIGFGLGFISGRKWWDR
jgi:hypothetical protein